MAHDVEQHYAFITGLEVDLFSKVLANFFSIKGQTVNIWCFVGHIGFLLHAYIFYNL